MKNFFDGIAWLFENVLFAPYNFLRTLALESWWEANIINWIFAVIGLIAIGYWMKQLKIFEDNKEENTSVSAHSFLE